MGSSLTTKLRMHSNELCRIEECPSYINPLAAGQWVTTADATCIKAALRDVATPKIQPGLVWSVVEKIPVQLTYIEAGAVPS